MPFSDKLFETLAYNDVLLTVNNQLLTYLSQAYETYQKKFKNHLSKPLAIYTFDTWLTSQYLYRATNLTAQPLYLLNPEQVYNVWEMILKKKAPTITSVTSIIPLLMEAWQLSHAWEIPIPQEKTWLSIPAIELWEILSKAFKSECQENHWVDIHSLPALLKNYIESNLLPSPKKIFLLGFEEFPPYYQHLLNSYKNRGVEILTYRFPPKNLTRKRYAFSTEEEEIERMAVWACQLHSEGKRIACVIPQLPHRRIPIFESFKNAYLLLHGNIPNIFPLSFSAPPLFSQYPMIQAALDLLTLKKSNSLVQISPILLSSFIYGNKTENSARALLDYKLKKEGLNQLDLNFLKEKSQKNNCPLLSDILVKLDAALEVTYFSPADWAAVFEKILLIWGWPGEENLSDQFFQLRQRWFKLLDQFSALTFIHKKMDYDTAYKELERLANSINFQPTINFAQPPIQLLGLLESAGMEYEYLWIMGMDENTWPSSPKPNPFIPISIQKEKHLPHSTQQRELRFSTLLTQRLLESADHLIVSHAIYDDQLSRRASPLFNDIPLTEISESLTTKTLWETIKASGKLESTFDELIVPLQPQEEIRGGAALLQSQGLCPFQAFARFRLQAKAISSPSQGINAAERGTLIHQVMHSLWTRIENSKRLNALSALEEQQVIDASIQETLSLFANKNRGLFTERFRKIEQLRLGRTIKKWLVVEKKRPPFRVIEMEQTKSFLIGPLQLSLRVDRVDQLENGMQLIIDYKTGKISPHDWFGEKIKAPQLPLYTLLINSLGAAISFASLHPDEMGFRGISQYESGISGIIKLENSSYFSLFKDWPMLELFWKSSLMEIARAFSEGQAHIQPLEGEETCRYCDLSLFCRIKS